MLSTIHSSDLTLTNTLRTWRVLMVLVSHDSFFSSLGFVDGQDRPDDAADDGIEIQIRPKRRRAQQASEQMHGLSRELEDVAAGGCAGKLNVARSSADGTGYLSGSTAAKLARCLTSSMRKRVAGDAAKSFFRHNGAVGLSFGAFRAVGGIAEPLAAAPLFPLPDERGQIQAGSLAFVVGRGNLLQMRNDGRREGARGLRKRGPPGGRRS